MIGLIEQNRLALQRLCAEYRVARLEVFGSAVTGEFDPARSDLDLLVGSHGPGYRADGCGGHPW
jgi:predicted nucleotidyltransferase